MFILRCPKCKHTMKYQPRVMRVSAIAGKSKRCMYCGRSFRVKDNIVKKA